MTQMSRSLTTAEKEYTKYTGRSHISVQYRKQIVKYCYQVCLHVRLRHDTEHHVFITYPLHPLSPTSPLISADSKKLFETCYSLQSEWLCLLDNILLYTKINKSYKKMAVFINLQKSFLENLPQAITRQQEKGKYT